MQYDPMNFGKPSAATVEQQPSGNTGQLPEQGKEQNIYPSGYMRSRAPSWHLLFMPFLRAMVENMMRGEKIDGPGNPPNYLKATPNEDQYSFDHLDNHLFEAKTGKDVRRNLVSVACNAMLIYHTICEREGKCKSQ